MASDLNIDSRAPAWLTIDLNAVVKNYKLIKGRVGPDCITSAVVKADSYGLGMSEVVRVLETQDCPLYIVATPDEAFSLRAQTKKPILALGGVFDGCEKDFIAHDIIPSLNSLADIDKWNAAAQENGNRLPCALHFDTGMNRLGLATQETALLLDHIHRLENLNVVYILSHFACADEAAHPLTLVQYDRFYEIAKRFPRAIKSLSNSAGIFANNNFHFGMVRPGQALYGLNPTPSRDNPMHAVASLDVRLLQTKSVKKGETVGYGATHKFKSDTVVGTIALGYADGFLRSLSNKGKVYFEGKACPIVGRVSMDLVTIALPDNAARSGDRIEIIGPHQSADALAIAGGTIGYEILTSLGARYQRSYKN